MRFLAIMTDGFEDMEAVGTIALLRRAGIDVEVAGMLDQTEVTGYYQTTMRTTLPFSRIAVANFDGIFIPGGAHTKKMRENPAVVSLVQAFACDDKWIAAICAAPSILGVAGVLDQKQYISYPGTEGFIPNGIRVKQAAVRDGFLITGAGAGAVIEFALEVIRAVLGEDAMLEVKKRTIYRAYESRP
jgi:protein deglycase